jgi:hypothetical protein
MERISRHTRSAVGGGKYGDDIMTGRVDAIGILTPSDLGAPLTLENASLLLLICTPLSQGWRGVSPHCLLMRRRTEAQAQIGDKFRISKATDSWFDRICYEATQHVGVYEDGGKY